MWHLSVCGLAFAVWPWHLAFAVSLPVSSCIPNVCFWALAAGAVLSGAYFGDRCSPVSGSAHLVASLTKTTPAANLRVMAKTSAVPFAVTCALFGVLGWVFGVGAQSIEAPTYLAECYSLSVADIVPALNV